MRRSSVARTPSLDARTVRRLVCASAVLIGALLGLSSAHAQGCGEQHDILVASDPLAPVRPADCAALLAAAPDFTWPALPGAASYSIALTFPDGHVETRSTRMNGLAWRRPLPPGAYRWTVRADGAARTSAARTFTIDPRAEPALALGDRSARKLMAAN